MNGARPLKRWTAPEERLVHTARLLRDPHRYIQRFGEENYRVMLADCLWHVYRMIGKLYGVAFVVGPPRGRLVGVAL